MNGFRFLYAGLPNDFSAWFIGMQTIIHWHSHFRQTATSIVESHWWCNG